MKITQKEKARANKTKEQVSILHEQEYKIKEITISALTANTMAFVFGIILLIPIFVAYYFKFGYLFRGPEETLLETLIIALLFFAMFPVHELIHGLFMYLFNGRNKNLIEFGIMSGNPYCTCQSPINKLQYVIIMLMPNIVFITLSLVLAFTFGKVWWLLFVIASVIAGGGDFTITWKLLNANSKNAKIIDHPYKCGFFLLKKDLETDEYLTIIEEIDNLQSNG